MTGRSSPGPRPSPSGSTPRRWSSGRPGPEPTAGSPFGQRPDTMTYLTALLPVEQGVAVYASLHAAVGSARATGDGAAPDQRGAGQVMADTLVERVTGQATAAAVPIEVQLVMPAETLVGERRRTGHAARRSPGAGRVRPSPPGRLRRRVRRRRCAGRSGPATAVHQPRRAPARRDGLPTPRLRRPAAPVPHGPRPDLPHPVVRRPDPARRPRGARQCRRPHQCHQRPGAVRGLQPRQGSARLGRDRHRPGPHAARPAAPPHRVRTTTPTGHTYDSTAPPLLPTAGASPATGHSTGPVARHTCITLTWAERYRAAPTCSTAPDRRGGPAEGRGLSACPVR